MVGWEQPYFETLKAIYSISIVRTFYRVDFVLHKDDNKVKSFDNCKSLSICGLRYIQTNIYITCGLGGGGGGTGEQRPVLLKGLRLPEPRFIIYYYR